MATTPKHIDLRSEDAAARRRRAAAVRGAGRLMDIGGTLTVVHHRSVFGFSVNEALASDWSRVGKDMSRAFDTVTSKESGRSRTTKRV